MFTPIGNPRGLPYPLQSQISNGNITSDAGLTLNEFVWPEDPEERTVLPLYLSQREFTAILSAMDVGADIAYPQQYVEVMWLMVRNLRYGVDICQLIADCIASSTETRQAIRDLVMSDPDINNHFTTIVEGMTTEQIVSPVIDKGCENGMIAGAVIQIVDELDAYNMDALQIMEVGTNDEERAAQFIAGIPVFGALPIDEVLDVMQDFLEDFAENYAAAITPEWKSEVSEDLYCIAKAQPDCKLTYELLFNYFQERATSGLTILSTAYDLALFITGGDFETDELVASGMYAVLLASLRVGREFFGMDAVKIGAIARDASSSSAWEDWDECEEPPPGDAWATTIEPPYETGVIVEQTTTSVHFEAEVSFDGVWRVNAERLEGCPVFTHASTTGATLAYIVKYLCAGGTSGVAMAAGDEVNKFIYAASGPFDVYLEW